MAAKHYREDAAEPTDEPREAWEDIEPKAPRLSATSVFALVCAVLVLAEGLFIVMVRPAATLGIYVGLSLAGVAAIWAFCRVCGSGERASELFARWAFPVLLFACGIAYLLFFPPGTVPDEDYHYAYTYAYANLLDPTCGEGDMRVEDYEFIRNQVLFNREVTPEFWRARTAGISLTATHEGTVTDTGKVKAIDIGTNPPQLKLTSALLMLVGRLLNLSGVAVFYLGRLGNFLLAFALIVAAVRLTPIGRNVMMAAALLPMTLHVLGSYSYDAGTIAFAFLLSALMLKVAAGKDSPSTCLLVGTVVTAVLLAPCKTIYYLLCLFALFIPARRFASTRQALLWKLAMVALPLVGMLALRLAKISQIMSSKDVAKREDLEEAGATVMTTWSLTEALARPADVFLMFLRSWYDLADHYLAGMLGGMLAWHQQNILAQDVQVTLMAGTLLLSAAPAADDAEVLEGRLRTGGLVVFVLVALASFAVMLLDHTVLTDVEILGVQGRYFTPALPLALLALRPRCVRVTVPTAPLVCMASCAFAFLYLAQIAFEVLGGAVA